MIIRFLKNTAIMTMEFFEASAFVIIAIINMIISSVFLLMSLSILTFVGQRLIPALLTAYQGSINRSLLALQSTVRSGYLGALCAVALAIILTIIAPAISINQSLYCVDGFCPPLLIRGPGQAIIALVAFVAVGLAEAIYYGETLEKAVFSPAIGLVKEDQAIEKERKEGKAKQGAVEVEADGGDIAEENAELVKKLMKEYRNPRWTDTKNMSGIERARLNDEFEQVVGRAFEACGYTVTVFGTQNRPAGHSGPGDGGIDVRIERDGFLGAVSCKRYATNVPVDEVRVIAAVALAAGATPIMVNVTGGYTKDSKTTAELMGVYIGSLDNILEAIKAGKSPLGLPSASDNATDTAA